MGLPLTLIGPLSRAIESLGWPAALDHVIDIHVIKAIFLDKKILRSIVIDKIRLSWLG
jgi:hypothetical protein